MFAFFDTVISFFENVFSFIGTIVSSILNAIALITGSLSFGYSIVGFMPVFLATCFYVFLFIFLIKFFVGR